MRTCALAAAAVVIGTGLLAAAVGQDVELQEYYSRDGKFRALLPPEVNIKDSKSGGTVTKSFVGAVAGDRVFVVSYSDLPLAVNAKQARDVLAGFAKSVAGKGGKVLSGKEVAVGPEKLPGRDVLIEQPKNFLRMRGVISGKRMYQVMALGPKDFVTSADADKVIESLEITK
jgi:hypothetical protein